MLPFNPKIGNVVVGADVVEEDKIGLGQYGDDASLALEAGESMWVGVRAPSPVALGVP